MSGRKHGHGGSGGEGPELKKPAVGGGGGRQKALTISQLKPGQSNGPLVVTMTQMFPGVELADNTGVISCSFHVQAIRPWLVGSLILPVWLLSMACEWMTMAWRLDLAMWRSCDSTLLTGSRLDCSRVSPLRR